MNFERVIFEKNKTKIISILKQAMHCAYYARLFSQEKIDVENISFEAFKKIPCTDKNMYEENKFDMLSDNICGFDKNVYLKLSAGEEKKKYLEQYGIISKMTSGSTGQPLDVLRTKREQEKDYFWLSYYRRKFIHYDFKGMFVWVWPISPSVKKKCNLDKDKDYKMVNEHGYRYNFFEHSEENYHKLYIFLQNVECEWLTISPSVAYEFALYIKRNHITYKKIKYIECHSEKLYDWQRNIIQETFECEVFSIYSSNEVQFMGMEINNQMILFDNTVFMEFIENKNGNREVCVTSLNYCDIPIIRYKLGDCGMWKGWVKLTDKMNMATFVLSGYRKNDMVITLEGGRVEPFVIADSVYYMADEFNLEIKCYKVKQVGVTDFYYFFDREIVEYSSEKCEKYLTKYLSENLSGEISVKIKDIEYCKDNNYYGAKYKYFECCLEIDNR